MEDSSMPATQASSADQSGFGISIRISKEGYRSKEEVEAQLDRYERDCRKWLADRGLAVDETAVQRESDVSGMLRAEDRQLGALVERVEEGALAGIVCPDVDRFGRNVEYGCAVWRRVVGQSGARL